MKWQEYFKVSGIVPGEVVIPGHGIVDFRDKELPMAFIINLYENDFPYLQITEKGRKSLYGLPDEPAIYEVPETPLPEYVTSEQKIPVAKTSSVKPRSQKPKKRSTKKE